MDPVSISHWVDCPACRLELERARATQPRKLNSASVCGPGASCNHDVGYSKQLGNDDSLNQCQERSMHKPSRPETSRSAAPTLLTPAESRSRLRNRFPFLFLDGENPENIPDIDSWIDYLREDSLSPLPSSELEISDSTYAKDLDDRKKDECILPSSVYLISAEELDSGSSKFEVPDQPHAEGVNLCHEECPKKGKEFQQNLDSELLLELEVHQANHGASNTQADRTFKVSQNQNQRPEHSSRYTENDNEVSWKRTQTTDVSWRSAEVRRTDAALESFQLTGQSQNSLTIFEMFAASRKETEPSPGTQGVFKWPTEQKRKEKYPNALLESPDSIRISRDIAEISTHPWQPTESSQKPEDVFKVPLPPRSRVKRPSKPTEPSVESWLIFDISNESPKHTETGTKHGEELKRYSQYEQDMERCGESSPRVLQRKPDHQSKQTDDRDLQDTKSDGSNLQEESDFHYVGLTHSPQECPITSKFPSANGHCAHKASSKNEAIVRHSESRQQGLPLSLPLDNKDPLLVQAKKSSRKRSHQNEDEMEPSQRDCTVTRRTSIIFFPLQIPRFPPSNEDITQLDSCVGQKEKESDRRLERENPNNPTLSILYSGEDVPSHLPCLATSGRLQSMLGGRNHICLCNDHQGAQVSSSNPCLSEEIMKEQPLPATSCETETGKSPQKRSATCKNRVK